MSEKTREEIKIIGPMTFNPFTESINLKTKGENKNTDKKILDEEAILNQEKYIIEIFDKKLKSIIDDGIKFGELEENVLRLTDPVKKILEAYKESCNAKTHAITTLLEEMLTILLVVPHRLKEFTGETETIFKNLLEKELRDKWSREQTEKGLGK